MVIGTTRVCPEGIIYYGISIVYPGLLCQLQGKRLFHKNDAIPIS